ncbi:ABC transporter ATP-binding protein [Gallibacter intestinalis]|uniref:ABC transporter ATP-binding protein n=1 Tax=Gallibacter intestinalis TaxID=2779356 RepID=A0ABR9QYQ8_9FIRM|nr:ABC transporter ATP-binding protein [Gallibacter intestinalis]MBE5036004.1 ABC transporter ATP-binding protein [Gallibacter intestinalis]
METVINIENLGKSFGDIHAVDNLSLQVRRGELFAFLGVNGAGKSTTISIICGQQKKDGGSVSVCGYDTEKDMEIIAGKIGVVFQNSVLDMALSVRDNLKSRAALYGIKGRDFENRLEQISHILSIDDLLKRTVGRLSGGQRRRIDIARALLHKPEILILDEPTTGLDPHTRKLIWNVIHELRKKENMTVFLTTHYMEETADADYVVIIDGGKIAAEGSPLELKNSFTGDYITIYGISEQQVRLMGKSFEKIRDGVRISVKDTSEATGLIMNHPELFKDYEITKGKMDDVFLAVTGKRLEGGDAR